MVLIYLSYIVADFHSACCYFYTRTYSCFQSTSLFIGVLDEGEDVLENINMVDDRKASDQLVNNIIVLIFCELKITCTVDRHLYDIIFLLDRRMFSSSYILLYVYNVMQNTIITFHSAVSLFRLVIPDLRYELLFRVVFSIICINQRVSAY